MGSKEEVSLGNETAIRGIEGKLETLTSQKAISVPKSITDKIWKLFNKQVKEKFKLSQTSLHLTLSIILKTNHKES